MAETSLLGRARELDELSVALGDARAGSGGVWLIAGEPGIGKSRLCEEIARLAARDGLSVAWGAAWEAGGAPAYWPWLQVLRRVLANVAPEALVARVGSARCAPLATLLPELLQLTAVHAATPHDPKLARFALLDAITASLAAAARDTPLLLILEDLHAADPESLELLDFAAAALRASALTIVGTYRDVEAARSPSAALFRRIAGRAHSLSLQRLRKHDVAAHLEQATGEAPSEALLAEVFDATEGNPLFLVETARLLIARGVHAGLALPSNVRAVIRERLEMLSTATRTVCEMASIVGRDFRRSTLAAMSGTSAAELAVPLADALDAAVLIETVPGEYRFTHILFRDVLYLDLERVRREQLHRALAQVLEVDGASLAEIAHHYLEAGDDSRPRAIACACSAGTHALSQFAFAEAAKLFRAATVAAAREQPVDAAASSQLHIELGRAEIAAGESERGKTSCLEAARLARGAGSAVLLAQASLAYGSVFVIAKVDPVLVALLNEAAGVLTDDAGLRARVLARLAAAMQPSLQPSEPIALAQHAIALARAHGDASTLLDVMRASVSAMMDLVDSQECLALHREYVALAERLHDGPETLRGMLRMVLAQVATGEIAAARATLERAERMAAALTHPHYRWRVAALRAAEAAFLGDFGATRAHVARALELAARSSDSNADDSLLAVRAGLLRLQARSAEAKALLLPALQRAEGLSRSYMQVIVDSLDARSRQRPEVSDAQVVDIVVQIGDRTLLEHAAEICFAARDAARASRLLALASRTGDCFGQGGMLAMTWDAPMARVRALLFATLGQADAARRELEHALEQCRALGSRTHEAWSHWDLARVLESHDAEAAAGHYALARTLARALDMPDIAAAAPEHEVSQPMAAEVARSRRLQMTRDGDVWRLSFGGRSVQLKDGKGLRLLDVLVREPGREHHVLELVQGPGAVDGGDAGEMLDVRARAAYRGRVENLRAQLLEAETANDLGRSERTRAELDALTQELARAVGLSGRARRSGSAVERARVNVQRRLRDAVRRIAEHDAELSRQLERDLRTGTFCCYDPS